MQQNELAEEQDEAKSLWSLDPYDPIRDSVLSPLFPSISREAILEHLESYLPEPLKAWILCKTYFANAAWL